MITGNHWSRHWDGPGELEYRCPCPKAPCGMAVRGDHDPACEQHAPERTKTQRSGHEPGDCPGPSGDVITGFPDHYIVNGDTSSCPCIEHDTFFQGMSQDDWRVPEGTAFVQREDGGWIPLGNTDGEGLILHVEPREEDITEDFLGINPFVNYRQRYVMSLESPEGIELEPYNPGEYMLSYCEQDAQFTAEFFESISRIPDMSHAVADSLVSMQESLARMGEAMGALRETDPHLFDDVFEADEIPMSGDAMRVSYADGREERPL